MKQQQRALALTSILFVALVVAVLEWRSMEDRSGALPSGISTPSPAHTQPLPSSASVATPAPPVASPPPAAPQATAAPPTASSAPVAQPPAPEMAAPDAPPKILSVSLTPSVAQAGETVFGTVTTSSNVASVEARIGGYGESLAKVGVGAFQLSYLVPFLPPPLRRTYTVDVIARNARGDQTTARSSITIH